MCLLYDYEQINFQGIHKAELNGLNNIMYTLNVNIDKWIKISLSTWNTGSLIHANNMLKYFSNDKLFKFQ